MELFESIGLKADPFTTSPNPDLFFPAKEHKQCLEGLELAIRMRRGLSVVRGGIGTGKTTISRKLIQNFSSEDDVKFEFNKNTKRVLSILNTGYKFVDENKEINIVSYCFECEYFEAK